ncbi:sulfhydryl oxidase [Alphaentomopoxvirus acuprea]|uniref:thiol oxidase n=1 Tax=Alphaentomopoxvirus acuprea TaxID=62099 RepID=W6JIM8_9POXV|nr:sulfhydryl oxidase [Anomala cuprea entomopoxvirus]BAO49428.1 sulfhydryl oxidase [Anomala cuprea entomopoxvirus]
MDTQKWGRGAWLLIFVRIYYTINIINKDNYNYELELLKKTLYLLCTSLPCPACSNHAKTNIYNNSIMSELDINRILHFFIEFYNQFHKINYIDITKINQYNTYGNDYLYKPYMFNFTIIPILQECTECQKNFLELISNTNNIKNHIDDVLIHKFSDVATYYSIDDELILDEEIKIKLYSF